MKLGVIGGAGLLGTTTAFCAGGKGIFEEIKLVDMKENMVHSHVMDMDQALLEQSNTRISFATYADLADVDIIMIGAAMPERQVQDRNEKLNENLNLIKSVCSSLKNANVIKNQIIINTTNPVDIFNYVVQQLLELPRERVIGFSANDTLRFKWAISKTLNVPYKAIDAICLGEHGDGQVAIYSGIKVDGKAVDVDADKKANIAKMIGQWYLDYNALDSKRTTGWTSGIMLARYMELIAEDGDTVINCSAVLDGEYGQKAISIGVPVQFGKDGIKKIVDIPMSDEEKASFDGTSAKIRSILESIGF